MAAILNTILSFTYKTILNTPALAPSPQEFPRIPSAPPQGVLNTSQYPNTLQLVY